MISSTEELVRQLVKAAEDPAANGKQPTNTAMQLEAQMLARILRDNREQLVASNQVNDGSTKQEAEEQIDTLLEIVRVFRSASVRLDSLSGRVRLSLEVKLRTIAEK